MTSSVILKWRYSRFECLPCLNWPEWLNLFCQIVESCILLLCTIYNSSWLHGGSPIHHTPAGSHFREKMADSGTMNVNSARKSSSWVLFVCGDLRNVLAIQVNNVEVSYVLWVFKSQFFFFKTIQLWVASSMHGDDCVSHWMFISTIYKWWVS